MLALLAVVLVFALSSGAIYVADQYLVQPGRYGPELTRTGIIVHDGGSDGVTLAFGLLMVLIVHKVFFADVKIGPASRLQDLTGYFIWLGAVLLAFVLA